MRKPLQEQKDYFTQKSEVWLLPMEKEVGTQDVGNTDNVLSLMLDSLNTMLCFICISIVHLHYMQIQAFVIFHKKKYFKTFFS